MAQAARLNLRMQKEIKLLLNDPPPGVSINLSEDAGVPSSLSSIEARIEGPEGTVYSKGVFVLKMQIPERYPFQPPNVTFVTPIYHPNIDNGGRVCLDILNLPPKGAWQPSLNISTVLMSIGLLLREPNPDDGLMAEISREYKYNRHVFDLNACSWTGKYANAAAIGTTGLSSIDASVLAQKSQREEVESLEALPKVSNLACEGSHKKMRLLGQKLSLKSQEPEEKRAGIMQQNATPERMVISSDSGGIWDKECQGNRKQLHLPEQNRSFTSEATSKRNNSNGEYMLPSWLLSSASKSKHCILQSSDVPEKTMIMSNGDSSEIFKKPSEATRTNLRLLGRKLSMQAKVPEKKINDEQENITPSPLPSSMPGSNDLLRGTSDVGFGKRFKGDSCLVHQTPNVTENVVVPDTNVVSNKECHRSRKKLRILSEKLSLKPDLIEKESAVNMEHTAPDWPQRDTKPKKLPLSASVIKNANADFGAALNHSNCPIKQNATAAEIVVVSDSEESSDECDRPSRSRLSLMRRRLARK